MIFLFGFLKKKLKESIEKISSVVKKKEEEIDVGKVEEAAIEQEIEERKKGEEVEEEIISIKPEEKKPKKRGLLEKLKKRIKEKVIKEEDIKDVLWNLQISLIESDVAVEVAEKICSDLKASLVGKTIERKETENVIKETLKNSILDILNVNGFDLIEKIKKKKEKPFLITFLGFNGSGKSTSIAKLGHLFKQEGLSCVFAAADSWRAAAIEQLEEHGQNLGIRVIKQKYGADPAAIVWDAVAYGKAHNIDVVLADTAGRSHANTNLMDEIKKVCRVNKSDLKILAIDSLTGNDVVEQARVFNEAVGVDAIIMTKADVYEKGGAVLSTAFTIKKPILYMGIGQNYGDIKEFKPEEVATNLLS